jgi:hypothetical protein
MADAEKRKRKDASYRKSQGIFATLRREASDLLFMRDLTDDEISVVCMRIVENSSDDDDMETLRKVIIEELKKMYDSRDAKKTEA